MMKRLRIRPTHQIRSFSWVGLSAALVLSVALVVMGVVQASASAADEPGMNTSDFAAVDRYIKNEMEATRLPGLALRGLVGLLLVVAAVLLITGRERRGAVLGYFGLLFTLTSVTLLDFYFSQFEAIVASAAQFALLMGVILYRQRYLASEPGSGLPSAHAPSGIECR